MKFIGPLAIIATVLLSGNVWSQEAATVNNNPYASIVARDMFGLAPIIEETNAVAPLTDFLPKIVPKGLMTILGRDQVLYEVISNATAGQPATQTLYVSCEGEWHDGIEVVKIRCVDGTATFTFDNHGTVQELPLAPANRRFLACGIKTGQS